MMKAFPFLIPILVSALATFLVRALPYYASFLDRLPRFLSKSLRLLPIAALGPPLIFPGVILTSRDTGTPDLLVSSVQHLLPTVRTA